MTRDGEAGKAMPVPGAVEESGLVRENGEVRPAGFAAEAMAEAVDGAVAMIVEMMEEKAGSGAIPGRNAADEVVRAVDDRLEDVRRKMGAGTPSGRPGPADAGRSGSLLGRRTALLALRRRARSLAL